MFERLRVEAEGRPRRRGSYQARMVAPPALRIGRVRAGFEALEDVADGEIVRTDVVRSFAPSRP